MQVGVGGGGGGAVDEELWLLFVVENWIEEAGVGVPDDGLEVVVE